MAKVARLEQTDLRRMELEAEYRETLIAALEQCASGRWRLFAHNTDKRMAAKVAPVLDELSELDAMIAKARNTLGLARFTLHEEFLAARGPASPNAVGEPKQAKAWLERLS